MKVAEELKNLMNGFFINHKVHNTNGN